MVRFLLFSALAALVIGCGTTSTDTAGHLLCERLEALYARAERAYVEGYAPGIIYVHGGPAESDAVQFCRSISEVSQVESARAAHSWGLAAEKYQEDMGPLLSPGVDRRAALGAHAKAMREAMAVLNRGWGE